MSEGKSTLWTLLTRDLGTSKTRKPGAYRGPRIYSEFRRDALLEVTNILRTLTKTNFPLVEGMHMAALESRSRRIRPVLESLAQAISVGFTLWEAMAAQTRFFPRWYVDLVRIGETTGSLPRALEFAGKRIREHSDLFTRLFGSLYIVGGELIALVAVFVFMVINVFPTFQQIFADFGTGAPAGFEWLFELRDDFFSGPSLYRGLPGVAGIFVLLIVLYRRVEPFRVLIVRMLLSLPFIRQVVRDGRIGHFSMMTAHLLRARTPLNETLDIVSEADVGPYFRRAFKRVSKRVSEGSTLAEALTNEPGFSKAYVAQVRIAEVAEDLPGALESLGERYRGYSDNRKEILIQVVLPALMLFIGAIVLVVELAVFRGIVALSESVNVPV